MPEIQPEMAAQMKARLSSGEVDQFGAKGINVFVGDGEGWCLSEAPNADAVCDSHAALGFPTDRGDVREVTAVA